MRQVSPCSFSQHNLNYRTARFGFHCTGEKPNQTNQTNQLNQTYQPTKTNQTKNSQRTRKKVVMLFKNTQATKPSHCQRGSLGKFAAGECCREEWKTILWFNWSSCNQQDSNIASKEITVKKVSSLKTEEMKCNRSTIMETLNSFHPGKRCGTLPSSKWREGSDSVWQGARGARGQGEHSHLI